MEHVNVQPIRDAMKWFDAALNKIRAYQAGKGDPLKITCAKGCFACCDEPLKVLEGEVDLILADLSPVEKENLKVAVLAWLNAAKAHKLEGMVAFNSDDLKADGKKINAFQYRAFKLTCPLLQDGVCSVYENRPTACRMHMACGPRIMCEDLAQRPNQKFLTIMELDAATASNLIRAHALAGYTEVGVAHLGHFLAVKLGLLDRDVVNP